MTTALKALRDVGVPWLQRWRRGLSRGVPAVDAKWLAGAREEHRLDMIDRRRPQPWTHAEAHETNINQDLLIIGKRCVLLVGCRGGIRPMPLCPLSPQHVARLRVGYEGRIGSDMHDSYQTIAPSHITSLVVNLYLHP